MSGFRERQLRAPWWVLALWSGGTFGVLWFLLQLLIDHDAARSAVVFAVPAGVVFGIFMGLFAARSNDRYRAARGTSRRVGSATCGGR